MFPPSLNLLNMFKLIIQKTDVSINCGYKGKVKDLKQVQCFYLYPLQFAHMYTVNNRRMSFNLHNISYLQLVSADVRHLHDEFAEINSHCEEIRNSKSIHQETVLSKYGRNVRNLLLHCLAHNTNYMPTCTGAMKTENYRNELIALDQGEPESQSPVKGATRGGIYICNLETNVTMLTDSYQCCFFYN